MVNNFIFMSFTVQQLFPAIELSEKDDKRVQATTITNSVFKTWGQSDLTLAQSCAKSHYERLCKKLETWQVDRLLLGLHQKRISDPGLTEIAKCYGYQFNRCQVSDGSIVSLQPIK